jgi:hypothetical protein
MVSLWWRSRNYNFRHVVGPCRISLAHATLGSMRLSQLKVLEPSEDSEIEIRRGVVAGLAKHQTQAKEQKYFAVKI